MERGWYRGTPSDPDSTPRMPKQLAIATSTTTQSGITTDVSITGLSIQFAVTDYPVEVELYIPWITFASSAAGGWAYIADGTPTATQFVTIGGDTTQSDQARVVERITVPGTYTRLGRVGRTTGTGTITILGNLATIVGHIKATEYKAV